MKRTGSAGRATREVTIKTKVNIDGSGKANVRTGIKFLDHLIETLAAHSMINIDISAKGDLLHHIVEDTAIALGQALDEALGSRAGIARFGSAIVPMDEALASAAVDLVKRPYAIANTQVEAARIEDMATEDVLHFLRSFAESARIALHLNVTYGQNDHHKIEACFKALAIAIRQACAPDPRRKGPPSSKGTV